MDSAEENHAANYIFVLNIVYFISAFVGAAFFPQIFGVECSVGNYIAGFGAFFFFGILLWPIFSAYNILMYFVFSVLVFLFLGFMFEFIIGMDRKGGDIPVDEKGLRQRLKRAKILFAIMVIVSLITIYIAIYNRSMSKEYYETGFQAGAAQAEEEWKENYDEMKASRDNYRNKFNNVVDELSFWGNYAVIVTETGEKYHTYGCQYVEGRSFWIYNVDAAISRGYEPCSVCDPPRG